MERQGQLALDADPGACGVRTRIDVVFARLIPADL
jgi:hypothetical protein